MLGKIGSSCSSSFRQEQHTSAFRVGSNGGNSCNCFERKILDLTGMTSRFAANGTEGLPKRPTKRGPEGFLTLPVEEFLPRFLLHLLPRGFMRIRNFGFLANRRRAELLALCSRLL